MLGGGEGEELVICFCQMHVLLYQIKLSWINRERAYIVYNL